MSCDVADDWVLLTLSPLFLSQLLNLGTTNEIKSLFKFNFERSADVLSEQVLTADNKKLELEAVTNRFQALPSQSKHLLAFIFC